MQKVYIKSLPKSCMGCFACYSDDHQCECVLMDNSICSLRLPLRGRHENCPLGKLTPYIIEGEKRWIDKVPTTNNKNTWTIREVE